MDETLNTVNEVQGSAVEAPQAAESTSEVAGETFEASQAGETAKPQQTAEENARFAQFRREAEAARAEATRLKSESESVKAGHEKLLTALKNFGYQGAPQDIADTLEAQKQNITVAQLRAQRAMDEKRIAESLKTSPEFVKVKTENEKLRDVVSHSVFEKDTNEINKLFPDLKIKDVSELGEQFMMLRAQGISNLVAYNAVKASQDAVRKPVPPAIGAVNAISTQEKDYYTSNEVDHLTSAQLNDPKIMKAVMKSMTKWR